MRTYQLILQSPNSGVVSNVSCEGLNALDAFENAVDSGLITIPSQWAGRVVAVRLDGIAMTFELGYAG